LRIKTENKKKNHLRRIEANSLFNIINIFLWVFVLLIIIYPLYLIIIASFSDPYSVLRGEVVFFPVKPSLIGYEAILKYSQLWRSYFNSIVYTLLGTSIGIIVTMMAAYSLTNHFTGRSFFSLFFVFTMFFSGGLIPTFLIIKNLGLYNSPIVVILLGSVSVWNLMIARTYISSTIPKELHEAAYIDGASHLYYFFKIVIPLSPTIIAVLCVYYAVWKWNDYFVGLIFLKDRQLMPLQTILREILATLQMDPAVLVEMTPGDAIHKAEMQRIAEAVKYCAIVISTGPAVLLFLSMQRYFIKGVMIGSIKG
jgi:putative aldouronate transport system permease protein